MVDETFLLHYLTMKTLDNDDIEEKKDTTEEMQKIVIDQMIDKMLELNENLSEEQIQKLDEIGMVWSVERNDRFEEYVEAFIRFRKNMVPVRFLVIMWIQMVFSWETGRIVKNDPTGKGSFRSIRLRD